MTNYFNKFNPSTEWGKEMANQEMQEVPEYRSVNTPSQASIDEAYQRGYENGIIDGYNQACQKMFDLIKNSIYTPNHHHGDE